MGYVVISLFDGISCGQIALQKAGISVKRYYAAEISKTAIAITQKNFPNTIQLGDVNNWKSWKIDLDPGDKLIIATFANYNEIELEKYQPLLVYVDTQNKITITKNSIAMQAA